MSDTYATRALLEGFFGDVRAQIYHQESIAIEIYQEELWQRRPRLPDWYFIRLAKWATLPRVDDQVKAVMQKADFYARELERKTSPETLVSARAKIRRRIELFEHFKARNGRTT